MTERDEPHPDEDEPSDDEQPVPAEREAAESDETISDVVLIQPDDPPIEEPDEVAFDLDLKPDEIGIEPPADEQEADDESVSPDVENSPGVWNSSTGALLLGALDPADAAAAGLAIANDAAARSEIVSLLPVADILTSLYQTQSGAMPSQEATPQGALTTRSPGQPKAERSRSQPVAIPKSKGVSPAAWTAIGLGVLAALGILWALAQRDQTSTREQEIHALQTRVADLEIGGNASVFVLNPVSDEASGGKATVFYSPGDGTVLLSASGLPELDDDQVYQVWYQSADGETWQPGPTFRVNDSGEIVRRLGSEALGFENMAISIEPAPGSSEPSGEFLLQGALVRAVDQ